MISDASQWTRIELRHLIALQAIAETSSFGRAAVQVGYTQSAISQQIAALEEIVGERLIERSRGPRPVALTEPGQMLVRHAEAITAHLRAAQADVAAFQAGEAGLLRVGTYQSVGARVLPGTLRSFVAAWPGVEARLTEDSRDVWLLALLARGDLDLAFTILPLLDGPYAAVELLADPWVAIIAADAPLATCADPLPLSALADQPLIGFRQCRSSLQLEDRLREQGVAPNVVFRSDDNGTVRGLAAAGMGIALAPLLAVETDPRVVIRPLAEMPPRVIGLAGQRDRYQSRAMRACVETAQAFCQTVVEEPVLR